MQPPQPPLHTAYFTSMLYEYIMGQDLFYEQIQPYTLPWRSHLVTYQLICFRVMSFSRLCKLKEKDAFLTYAIFVQFSSN